MTDFKQLKKNIKSKALIDKTLSVALLGDSATQFLGMGIVGAGVERGYNINLFEADYNQIEQQIIDKSSDYHVHNSKYTIIFQSTHKLLEKYSLMESSDWKNLADDRINYIKMLCESVDGNLIYFNYPEIDDTVFGSYANKTEDSFSFQIRKLNYNLMLLSNEYYNLYIYDLASIQNKYGRSFVYDPSIYVNTEMLLSIDVIPIISFGIMDIIGAMEGQFKKCLIVDLDNTLWGGVVGDDGWENIQLGHGLGIGKVYTELQQWIKKLKNRGVIICVCSKNDEDKAKEAFQKNPEMVLTLDDISVFVANWENKADNIRLIQSILNIGFDSMCFLDDNPAERSIVKQNIPEITVPELPDEPERYLEYLYSLNLFETVSYSSNDKNRTKQYQIDAKRVTESKKFTNVDDFLCSLEMISEVSSFSKYKIPRVAQLSQRSNQFNLRTIRYTENQISEIENSDYQFGFVFSLEDKYGDNGLVAVVILTDCSNNNADSLVPGNVFNLSNTLFIDTWFMSCRVLKRGMENFTLNTIVKWAKEHGYKRIIGEYLPTKKNGMVENHYLNLGFNRIDNVASSQWLLVIDVVIQINLVLLLKRLWRHNYAERRSFSFGSRNCT